MTTTVADTLAVLKLLEKGRPVDFVTEATGLPSKQVVDIAERYGWPDKGKLQWAVDELTRDAAAVGIPVREPDPAPPTSRPAPQPATTRPRPATAPAPGETPPIPAGLSTPASRRDVNGSTNVGRPIIDTSKMLASPLASAPPATTVDELVRACRRSDFKRTQALGVKLTELAEKITTALRDERAAAEAKAKQAAQIAAAQAEVKRLEQALAEARKKAVAAGASGGARGGPVTCPDCADGREFASAQALGAHAFKVHGIRSSKSKTSRSATA